MTGKRSAEQYLRGASRAAVRSGALLLGAGLLAFVYELVIPSPMSDLLALGVALIVAFSLWRRKSRVDLTLTKGAYVVAFALGLVAMSAEQRLSPPVEEGMIAAMATTAGIFAIGGVLASALTSQVGWRLGLTTVFPFAGLLLLSVLFAGEVGVFLRLDAPILAGALVGGLTGGAAAAAALRRLRPAA